MSSVKSNIFSSSEGEQLKSLLKNPEQDLEEIISLLERKVEERSNPLRETDEKYQSLIDGLTHVGIGIDIVNKDYEVLFQNQILKERFGDCVGKNCFRSYMDLEKQCEFCPMEKALKHNKVERTELTAADGRSYELISAPYPNRDGSIDKVAEVVIDITERKKTEKKLRESEEKYRNLFNNSPFGIFLFDEDENLLEGNASFSDSFSGFPSSFSYGKNFTEIIQLFKNSDELLQIFKKRAEDRIKGKELKPLDVKLVRQDGEIRWLHWQSSTLQLKDEVLIQAIVQDITERKYVEDAFLEEKKFTEVAINAQRDTFFIYEPSTGKAVRWNQAFREYSGYSDEEISIMKAPDSYYNKDDLKRVALADEKIDTEGEALIEMNLITKNGNEIPFEYLGSSINDDEGNLKYIIATGRDITKRKQADEALRESERFLKKAQIIAHIGHWKLNPLTLEVSGSDELFKIFELSHNEATLDAFTEVVHPDDREYDLYHIGRGIEHGESWDIEHRLITKKGTEKWVHALGEAVKNENGEIIMLLGTVQDITERKEVEQVLYHEQDLIRTLLDNYPDFIYFKDSKARFQHISKHFCEYFGKDREDIIGKTDLELFPPEIAKQTHTEDLQIIKTGKSLINKEETDGETWVLTTKMPWLDKEGNVKGLFGISRDITDLKKAEQNIKESEEKFRNITEQSLMGIAIIQDNIIKYASKRLADIYGYSVEELLNFEPNGFLKLIDSEFLEAVKEQATKKQLGQEEVLPNYEVRCIKKTGEKFWVENYSKTIKYNGKPADFVTNIDITERKKTEQLLKESEERYRGLINNITDIIYELDINGKCTYVSNQLFDISRFHPEELIGQNLFQYLHPEDFSNIIEKVKEAFNKGIRISADFRLQHKDGHYVPVSSNFNVIRINDEQRFIGVLRDNTEKRNAELKLRESEEKYRALFDNSPVGIGLSTIEGEVLDSNDAMVELTGYNVESLNNAGINSIYADSNERSKILKLLEEEGDLHDYEVKLRRKDNTEFFGSISLDLIELGGRKIIQISMRDITKSKNAELELIKLNSLKSELLRRTSHELKTPLVSIKGFSDLLLQVHRDKLEAIVISVLNEIKQGCLRLENLIADILKTSELESDTIQLRKSEEDLSFLIRLCVNEIKGLSILRNQHISLEIPESLETLFEKEQVHQVISNVLNNAVKYTPPGGLIEIKSEIKNNFIITSIRDNGIGFSDEEKDRIFKQFGKVERYGQGLDIISEGSGLGLYISKKIIELHGGKIWVESEGRNKGSTFYFSLPLTENF